LPDIFDVSVLDVRTVWVLFRSPVIVSNNRDPVESEPFFVQLPGIVQIGSWHDVGRE
jgi:hypothetical protein